MTVGERDKIGGLRMQNAKPVLLVEDNIVNAMAVRADCDMPNLFLFFLIEAQGDSVEVFQVRI